MSKRINVILPDSTLALLDRVAGKGKRSRTISTAVVQFLEAQSNLSLRERLKREALANAERDVRMAAEWSPLEEEASEGAARSNARKTSSRRR